MSRRRKKYVAPRGVELRGRQDGETEWQYLAYFCKALATWVPHAAEPETRSWDDPEESMRKERWEKQGVENEYAGEGCDAFEVLLSTGLWPETSEQAAFLMRERLAWAAKICDVLGVCSKCGHYAFSLLPSTFCPCEKLIFLTGDFYDAVSAFPKKWWDGSGFESYYR